MVGTGSLRRVRADLHVHTVGSPCAEIEMIPPLIVERAKALGLGLIAVTDHNSAENVEAVMTAARGSGVAVLPGMEVQTREEVHILALFDRAEQALEWQRQVYAALPPGRNVPEALGIQLVVDAEGNFVRVNERLLLTSVSLSVDEVVSRVRDLGGLAIAAHVDRSAYSLLANLGLVPEGLELAAMEISARIATREAVERFPQLAGWPLIKSGDAHVLDQMSANLVLTIADTTVEEIELALAGLEGRSFTISEE